MYSDCHDCKRLCEEVSEATQAHLAVLGKYQIARIEQNSAAILELEPLTVATAERRSKARLALNEHKAIHQNGHVKVQHA